MRIIATIEARMTSSRLPGKVLLPANGKPMLEHLVSRLRRTPSLSGICLATTTNPQDEALVHFAHSQAINVFRGSEQDVMARVIGAGEHAQADILVEITGDCPLIDPEIAESTIQLFLESHCDYAHNLGDYPAGMDVQVYSLSTLKKSFSLTAEPLDREHVTRHIRMNTDLFTHAELKAPPELVWPELGLTLDEQSDYEFLCRIIEHFAARTNFSYRDIAFLLRNERPEWLKINQSVYRKGLSE